MNEIQNRAHLSMHDGLAVYRLGAGEPLLLLPYPHGSTMRPMAEGLLAAQLAGLGRSVITFDPPGAYRSTRPPRVDMQEMQDSALEALQVSAVAAPVDVVGHSMGSLCALGLAVEQSWLVRRIVLIGSLSGWPAAVRWSTPHNWRWWRDQAWWQCIFFGTAMMLGRGNLQLHKRLDNLVKEASFVDKSLVEPWTIEPGDRQRPPPVRSQWLRAVQQVDYRDRLGQVQAPTLLGVGRHDPQTPVVCSEELADGIPGAQLVVFERSGHSPFLEEPDKFLDVIAGFLKAEARHHKVSTEKDHG